ncbi:MAG TPA: helix-turn-helix domain-containing protein [Thermoanaerobaculia bacterium]|nr:helix-turn-helix domain-containing protein [Thermoanaerobaculia bacterium]
MERKIPPPLSLALDILRTRQGWTQKELAAATGIPANLLSDYERGRKTLSRERLDSLLEAMGLQPPAALRAAMRFLQDEEIREPDPPGPEDRQIEVIAAESGRLISDATRSLMKLWTTQGQALEERRQARALWERLKRRDAAQRRLLVEKVAKFRSWALCELLCEESIKAAGDSADRALDLAGLALRVAELSPGEEAWRQRVQGYAWAHVGNARRVKGDLPAADEAFGRAQKLWRSEISEDFSLLNEARVLDLEASLRREQARFNEALALLGRALTIDGGTLRGHLLINRANTFLSLGDYERAADTLRQAVPVIESDGEPRLLFALKFALASSLCFLGRYHETQDMLPSLWDLAGRLGNDLDYVRLRWLQARGLAGLGKRQKAIESLSQVRGDLIDRDLPYDIALVSLELAVLYLEDHRLAEVRVLARQMTAIFQSQKAHRQALAAVKLFRDAVEQEAVTVDLARKMVAYMLRAQHDPTLRFEDI